LKCKVVAYKRKEHCRSPRGERGLKYEQSKAISLALPVAPHAGSVD